MAKTDIYFLSIILLSNKVSNWITTKIGMMMSIIKMLLLATFLLSSLTNAHDTNGTGKQVTSCKEPRPQMCTMDYTPVCGLLDGKTIKAYSNACSACSDNKVGVYIANKCEVDSLKYFDIEQQISKDVKKKS